MIICINKKIFLSCQYNILSMWMEYSYIHGEYLTYMARILLKDFLLLTKIQLTAHKLIVDVHVLT